MALFQHHKGPAADGGKDKLTKASTAITKSRVVSHAADGYIAHYVSGTNPWPVYVAMEAKSASDASTNPIQLLRISLDDEFIAEVRSGQSVTQANVGDRVDIHTDGTVDPSATTNKDVTILGIHDSTHVVVRWNTPIA